PGTWSQDHRSVLTAKGQPFERRIMVEYWRHLGHLYFGPVVSDYEHYEENSSYARLVRSRAATANVSERNHRVAFQRSVVVKGKAGEENAETRKNEGMTKSE